MILIAFAAHLVLLGLLVAIGDYRLRPRADGVAYTVEIVDEGELGGHMPAGLPKLDVGGAPGPERRAAKAAPKPPPPPRREEPPPPPKPEPEPEPPPKPEAQPQPPPPPQQLAQAESEDDLIVATPAPTPRPTAKPTAAPTARPTPPPTPRPTARPTAAPTARPTAAPTARPTAKPTAKPTERPKPTATPRPSPTRAPARPTARPADAPRPTASSVIVRSGPTATPARDAARARAPQASPTSSIDARIAEAVARVQRNVEGSAREGSADATRAPGGQVRGSGGVGGTDAPDPNRRLGVGPGRGGAGQLRGTEFLLYYNQMLARIRDAWVYPGAASDVEVKVRFRILEDGTISDLKITQPSGDPAYDSSVLRAVRAASPLPPPPERYRTDFSDVELTFQPGDLQGAR